MEKLIIFVTAPDVASKVLNRALLLLQHFELSEPLVDSPWVILTSSNLPDKEPKPTVFPVEISMNHFGGKSLDEIDSFMRSNDSKLGDLNVTRGEWVTIDQEGVESDTCLVYSQDMLEEGSQVPFKAARLPYTEAWGMIVNLSLGNMGFEEWIDEDAGVQKDGAYKWIGPFGPTTSEAQKERDRDTEARRKAVMEDMRELGHID